MGKITISTGPFFNVANCNKLPGRVTPPNPHMFYGNLPNPHIFAAQTHHGPPWPTMALAVPGGSAPSSASAENPARRRSMRLKPPEAVDVLPHKNHGIHYLYKQFSVSYIYTLIYFYFLFIHLFIRLFKLYQIDIIVYPKWYFLSDILMKCVYIYTFICHLCVY